MIKKIVSVMILTLLLASILTLAYNIQPIKAVWVSDLPIPYLPFASGVAIDGEMAEEAWCHADHSHNYSVHKKTIEFDVYLMHDGVSLYIGGKIHENDFWSTGWLPDSFQVEINDRNDEYYGGDSGNDIKRVWATATGLGNYEDKYIPHDAEPDVTMDGEGAFNFSGVRQDGEIGDYYFEMRIPINGTHPEDAKISEGFPFGMMISFCDYDPDEDVGYGYWLLQGSYVLTAPKTWTVDDDGPADFHSIQEAINNASDGDTIFVRNGTYYENVVVDKAISLIGENRDTTVIDGQGMGHVVLITADDVTFSGFTIQNSGSSYPESGIFLDIVTETTITNNIVSNNNGHGVFAMWANDNCIYDNLIANNNEPGIRIDVSRNKVFNNTINNNPDGIFLYGAFDCVIENNEICFNAKSGVTPQGGSRNITILNNDIYFNGWHGIFFFASNDSVVERNVLRANGFGGDPGWVLTGVNLVEHTNNNILKGNEISDNKYGTCIWKSSNNTITDNNITNSTNPGIWLAHSNHSLISENNITEVFTGIKLTDSSNNNNIHGNNITRNEYGIKLSHSSNNTISRNKVATTNDDAITLEHSSNYNTLTENEVTASGFDAIWIWNSSFNIITENEVTASNFCGVELHTSSNCNTISRNTMKNNEYGIRLSWSSNNSIVGNDVTGTNRDAIYVYESSHNSIYKNNFVSITSQVYTENSVNVWDNGCEGNYWSDYNGTDSDGDGIGDTPYVIDENNRDNYPLMNPYWLPGDVNHDLKIDIYDVVRITGVYNSQQGDPNWNCHSDIAEPYGIINIYDVVTCTKDYRKEYTP